MQPEMLEPYKIRNAPNTVYYIPDFITEMEEDYIIKNVYNVPRPKWTCLKNRRVQDYGGIPHKNGMIVEPVPVWLQTYMDKVSDLKIFEDKRANHVLVNEYQPGQGIMPHLDGNLFYPTISTISCGSHTILEFYTKDNDHRLKVCDLLLEPRSLVVLQDDMYNKYLHSISEKMKDQVNETCLNLNRCIMKPGIFLRQTRISLTIRNVPKICKVQLFNMLKPK